MTAGTIIRPLLLGVLLAVTFSMSCGNIPNYLNNNIYGGDLPEGAIKQFLTVDEFKDCIK